MDWSETPENDDFPDREFDCFLERGKKITGKDRRRRERRGEKRGEEKRREWRGGNILPFRAKSIVKSSFIGTVTYTALSHTLALFKCMSHTVLHKMI